MSEEKKELERETSVEETAPEQKAEEEKQPERLENSIYDWARSLTAAVVGVVLLFTFLARLIGVSGPSMQDTLYTGDRILVLNAMFCDFQPGDVVVVNDYNAQLDDTLVKRIIAVGGQTVDIDFVTGTVYVEGVALDEPYIKEPTYTTDGTVFPLTLAEDEVFIMGDNRNHSTDSRSSLLGVVDERYVVGKAVLLIFPGRTAQYLGELPGTGKRDFGRIGLIA